jgi:hypothetical protein
VRPEIFKDVAKLLVFRDKNIEKAPLESSSSRPKINRSPGSKNQKELYHRVRWLWKNHAKNFTPWETKFCKSIGTQLKENRALTPKQNSALKKMLGKYNVPFDAHASTED